jgi:hypothetical protein
MSYRRLDEMLILSKAQVRLLLRLQTEDTCRVLDSRTCAVLERKGLVVEEFTNQGMRYHLTSDGLVVAGIYAKVISAKQNK